MSGEWPEIRVIRRADGEWTLGFLEAVGPEDESTIYIPAERLDKALDALTALSNDILFEPRGEMAEFIDRAIQAAKGGEESWGVEK